MSEALSLSDRIAARLERLAEMDLAAAEHVQAQLLATTEAKETADLARAYQRASRTLRQTLMLQMKHERDQAQAEKDDTPAVSIGDAAYNRLVNARIADIQGAVARVASAAHPDQPRLQRETLDRLDVELDDWADEDDFIDRPLDAMVVDACESLRLPLALARQWQDLPSPAETFDPAETPSPILDTG